MRLEDIAQGKVFHFTGCVYDGNWVLVSRTNNGDVELRKFDAREPSRLPIVVINPGDNKSWYEREVCQRVNENGSWSTGISDEQKFQRDIEDLIDAPVIMYDCGVKGFSPKKNGVLPCGSVADVGHYSRYATGLVQRIQRDCIVCGIFPETVLAGVDKRLIERLYTDGFGLGNNSYGSIAQYKEVLPILVKKLKDFQTEHGKACSYIMDGSFDSTACRLKAVAGSQYCVPHLTEFGGKRK